MTLLQAVAQMLWANTAFQAASPGGIMDTLLPETATTFPATTYQVVGGNSKPTLDTTGAQQVRVQFDCHGIDGATTGAARVVLRAALEGFTGVLADGSSIQALFIQAIDFYDYEPRQFRKACEFYILTNSTN